MSAPHRVYVPGDSGALSVGAGQVAQAIQSEAARRGLALDLIRNGSRGLYWLEPLVEVETAAGRVAYGPVRAQDVPDCSPPASWPDSLTVSVRGSPRRSPTLPGRNA
jgi:hypothetical protein